MPSSPPIINTRSPFPTTLVTPSQLRYKSLGDKVRFLGCVQTYTSKTALLTLLSHPSTTNPQPPHPTTRPHPPPPQSTPLVLIHVSVDAITHTLTRQDLEVGSWLNVLGYVASPPPAVSPAVSPASDGGGHIVGRKSDRRKPDGSGDECEEVPCFIQAVAVWNAGAVNLGEYEIALRERQTVGC